MVDLDDDREGVLRITHTAFWFRRLWPILFMREVPARPGADRGKQCGDRRHSSRTASFLDRLQGGETVYRVRDIQVLMAGMILWFWGTSVFRLLLFAWALVTFAWPLPFIDSNIAFPMRMIVSQVSYYTLNVIGFSCVRNGTAILFRP